MNHKTMSVIQVFTMSVLHEHRCIIIEDRHQDPSKRTTYTSYGKHFILVCFSPRLGVVAP